MYWSEIFENNKTFICSTIYQAVVEPKFVDVFEYKLFPAFYVKSSDL